MAIGLFLALALASRAVATPGAILFVQEDETVVRETPEESAGEVMRLARGHKVMEYARRGGWVNVGIFDTLGLDGWIPEARLGDRDPNAPPGLPPEPAAGETETAGETTASSIEIPPVFLEVSGTPALSFIGDCSLAIGTGNIEKRKLKGLGRKRFSFGAEAVSCTVQKWQSRGRLEVALWRGGRLIVANETSGPYNFVRVRTDGPWGRARTSRGGVGVPVLRRSGQDGVVPPFSAPTIPSFGPRPGQGTPR